MTEHLKLIRIKLDHLARMRECLAAFRVRFSEFQEHLGKAMRSVAIEEEQDVERFGAVLAFMERLRVIGSAEQWKVIRELRNAVNHEYEHDTGRLAEFFELMTNKTPVLFECFGRLREHCAKAYGI